MKSLVDGWTQLPEALGQDMWKKSMAAREIKCSDVHWQQCELRGADGTLETWRITEKLALATFTAAANTPQLSDVMLKWLLDNMSVSVIGATLELETKENITDARSKRTGLLSTTITISMDGTRLITAISGVRWE